MTQGPHAGLPECIDVSYPNSVAADHVNTLIDESA